MELVGLKVTIGMKAVSDDKGGKKFTADYPDFNSLPIIKEAGIDWSYWVDREGGGWHYDKASGHKEETADSPYGQQFGMLLVPEQFADEAAAKFASCTVLDATDAEDFYDNKAHAHEADEKHDMDALDAIERRRSAGAPIDPAIKAKMLDPNDPTPGIRKNPRKVFADFSAQVASRSSPKVLVSIPNRGWIHKSVAFVLLKLILNKGVTIILPTHNPLENSQAKIVNDLMAGDWDFWLNIDDDNPPTRNPLELTELNLDIIGLPTPIWHFTGKKPGERPIYWGAYDYVESESAYREHEPKEGLQKVDAISGGSFLISRRVFENPKMRIHPFQREWNEDGTVEKGNDICFSEKAIANGFEIHTHFGKYQHIDILVP